MAAATVVAKIRAVARNLILIPTPAPYRTPCAACRAVGGLVATMHSHHKRGEKARSQHECTLGWTLERLSQCQNATKRSALGVWIWERTQQQNQEANFCKY